MGRLVHQRLSARAKAHGLDDSARIVLSLEEAVRRSEVVQDVGPRLPHNFLGPVSLHTPALLPRDLAGRAEEPGRGHLLRQAGGQCLTGLRRWEVEGTSAAALEASGHASAIRLLAPSAVNILPL